MNNCFFERKGISGSIIAGIFRIIAFFPISFTVSVFITVINKMIFKNEKTFFIFMITMIIMSLFRLIYCNIVIIKDENLIFRNIIGKKVIVELNGCKHFAIIDTKEYNNILLNGKRIIKPLTNCSFITDFKYRLVSFENSVGQSVFIGVFDIDRLYNILKTYEPSGINLQDKTEAHNKNKSERFIIDMPIVYHFLNYFKHWLDTILLPAVYTSVIIFNFYLVGLKFGLLFFIILFFVLSLIRYYPKTLLLYDSDLEVIKFNCYIKNNKKYVKIEDISNLRYENTVLYDNSQIRTPGCDHVHQKKVCFKTEHNDVIIAVKDPERLFISLQNKE